MNDAIDQSHYATLRANVSALGALLGEVIAAAEGDSLLQRVGQSTGGALETAREQTSGLTQAFNTVKPVYTVPRNATLIGSTAMTALVGRVPVQGQVRDPMPFKVITGADNLAANGLTVPGVQGMVWSGTAIGDWTLSCVTGRLDSVTFVFADGTVQKAILGVNMQMNEIRYVFSHGCLVLRLNHDHCYSRE